MIVTLNKQLVGVRGETVVIQHSPYRLSKADALNVAAWLVALADDNNEFPAILEAVRNT